MKRHEACVLADYTPFEFIYHIEGLTVYTIHKNLFRTYRVFDSKHTEDLETVQRHGVLLYIQDRHVQHNPLACTTFHPC